VSFPSKPLRHRALRTALLSTAVVGIVLVVLVAAIDIIVARNLTAGIDDRLRDQLNQPAHTNLLPAVRQADQDFDAPVLHWRVESNGTVSSDSGAPALPASLLTLSGFTTAKIDGLDFRLAGAPGASGGYSIAGASLASVGNAESTLLVTELIVGPVLLLLIFGGSFAIGRRVASPVEAMRQQQLAFTADASHELRTPLSVIQAETSLLKEDSSGELLNSLERITGETQRMRRLVDDLLWLARFDAQPAPPSSEWVDLAEIATVAADRFGPIATTKSIALELQRSEAGPVLVNAAPEWLDRLAGVLLDNACRYTPAGGVVDVAVGLQGGHPRLAIRDSGPGLPEAEADRLMDRFHRASSVGEGAGLGLAIADSVVRATGGRWEISNRREGGAEFAIVWPKNRR
jgi:signal transduction histidine kinase